MFPIESYDSEMQYAVQRQDRADIINLPGTKPLALPHGPDHIGEMFSSVMARGAVAIVHDLAARIETASRDQRLSDFGRRERTETAKQEVVAKLANISHQIEAERRRIAGKLDELFNAPSIAPQDAAGALRDWEIRQWFAGLPADQGAQVLRDIADGEQVPVALALMRSPIKLPDHVHAVVVEAHQAAIRASMPVEVGGFELAAENAAWAQGALPSIGRAALELSGYERRQVFGLIPAEHRSNPAVLQTFGFDPHGSEVAALRNLAEGAK